MTTKLFVRGRLAVSGRPTLGQGWPGYRANDGRHIWATDGRGIRATDGRANWASDGRLIWAMAW